MEKHCQCPAFETLRTQPGDHNEAHAAAFASGHTGYPMVDACMRCLLETGWLNFRMRAMLASFAAYNLWLDWRHTAKHLGRCFLDLEPGIHYPQLQMQAGTTGINALRVPVGDWMWTPYWPYHGCADGAVDQLKRVLRHSQKLGLRVLIDLHGARQLCALTPAPRADAPLARAFRAIGYLPTLTVALALARSQACGALRTASTTAGRR